MKKRTKRRDLSKLRTVFLEEADRLLEQNTDTKITVWDVFVSIFSKHTDKFLLNVKADLEIIKYFAEGLSIDSISRKLSIPSKEIFKVADIWGITPQPVSLDFNPLSVYTPGMTSITLFYKINSILPNPITKKAAEDIINAIEIYTSILYYLEKEDT